MNSNTEVVNAFEAKTRLSELLRETEKGVSFRILRRGKEVARLIPPLREDRKQNLKQVLTSFKEVRGRVPGKIKIRELIEEGRRF
jgi:prevent-host-death family protein